MITLRSEHRNEKIPHKTTLDDFFLAITNHTPLPKVDCNLSQLFNEYTSIAARGGGGSFKREKYIMQKNMWL